MSETTTVRLARPIMAHGTLRDELTVRKPKVRDLRTAGDPDSPDYVFNLAAALTNVPPAALDEMDVADWLRLGRVVSDFLDNGTAENSSPALTNAADSSAH